MLVEAIGSDRRAKLGPGRVVEILQAEIRIVGVDQPSKHVDEETVGGADCFALPSGDAVRVEAHRARDRPCDAIDHDVWFGPSHLGYGELLRLVVLLLLIANDDLGDAKAVTEDPLLINLSSNFRGFEDGSVEVDSNGCPKRQRVPEHPLDVPGLHPLARILQGREDCQGPGSASTGNLYVRSA